MAKDEEKKAEEIKKPEKNQDKTYLDPERFTR